MRVCLMIEGQEGVEWQDWVALARAAEAAQLHGLFRSDHYHSLHGTPGAALDAWSTIAGLAPLTQHIRLGTLVSPATFRHPSVLARMVAAADHISNGRIELGLGAGWHAQEHAQNGFAFPDMRTRMELLAEQLEILVRSWQGETFDHRGKHYELHGQRALPRPIQAPHPPIILGGQGKPRSVRLAVQYANEYNTLASSLEQYRALRDVLDEACRQAGREPASLPLTIMGLAVIGDSAADADARLDRLFERMPNMRRVLDGGFDKFIGTVDAVAETLRAYERAGASRVYLNHFDFRDLDAVAVMGRLAKALA